MRISELKGRLANILEVSEDPVRLVGELLLRKDEVLERRSPKMLAMLVRAFALECIWEEFEEVLEREGKNINIEITEEEIEILVELTDQFFSDVEISRSEQITQAETQEYSNSFLEAISVVKSSL